MYSLDKINLEILTLLQKDSTLTVKDIAERVGLSPTPTFERIKSMEATGVINKYVTLLDSKKIGFLLIVYCNIVLKEQSKKGLQEFEKAVAKFPEIMEVISLSGTYDYMLKIATKDISAYNDFIVNKLSDIKNIGQYHSNIVMSMPKYETAFPLDNTK